MRSWLPLCLLGGFVVATVFGPNASVDAAEIRLVSSKEAKSDEAKESDDIRTIEKNIVEYTNRERQRRGMRPLKLDVKLIDSARDHAQWMASRRSLQHTKRPVGENIAMGQRSSKEAVNDWMNSKGHRANILNPSYTRIGAAAYKTKDGTIFWCQQFLF